MDLMGIFSAVTQSASAYKTAVETLDEAKVSAATNELQIQLMHLGAEVIAMQNKSLESTERERSLLRSNDDLTDRVRELEKRIAERERYELVEEYPGVFTLRLKESCQNGEPMHHLCPHCMDNGSVKSILQFGGSNKSLGSCSACKALYRFLPPESRHRSRRALM